MEWYRNGAFGQRIVRMIRPMNVILIGYRGSGKTSVGKKLAAQLWKTFVDVDVETCGKFGGKTIAAIWQESGEPAWRKAEEEVVRDLLAKDNLVIGLGGGTVMIPGLAEAMKAAPDTKRIYLRCEPEELHRRISGDSQSAATRPSLTTHGGGLEEIRTVLAQREPVYRQVADGEFDVTRVGVDDTVRYLIQKFL